MEPDDHCSSKCLLYFLAHCDSDKGKHLANGFIQWITEGVDADRVDSADTLDLDQVAPYTRHHSPDVQERQNGKINTPDKCHGYAEDCGEQAVKPVLCHCEGGEAGFPNPIETVSPIWFCDYIFKIDLHHVVVEVLGVSVDQVDLLGVDIMRRLLAKGLICHDFVVRFVNVSLLPDGRCIQKTLKQMICRGWREKRFKKISP